MVNWSEENRLAGTDSPYLEQHADNPVHWIPWGDEVFEEARRRDLPVLVSIGYSTCHWCHVMAHESFENPSVAAVMNAAVVNVKVDREQHPGVDAVYMEAAQVMTGSGGWPLNVFLDHDGRPFAAVTYLPSERWVSLITEIHRLWRNDRERIFTASAEITGHLTERRFSGGVKPDEWPKLLLAAVEAAYDKEHPGFPSGPQGMKFPPSQTLDWLLEYGGPKGRETALEILTAMMDSGLHDRVGGGFHRYSVDRFWRVPHFEKMTYDNAQLMGLFARAATLTEDAALARDMLMTARNTADWFLRDMRVLSPEGDFLGYATATDADDPLGEGGYFAWPPSELTALLGDEDAAWLAERWHLHGGGSLPEADGAEAFEPVASWIPHPRGAETYPESYRSTDSADDSPAREAALIRRLREARNLRPAPGRDDKVLTDQNALVLEGFSRLARYGGGETYEKAAEELADLMIRNMDRQPPLVRRTTDIGAYITDYGYFTAGLTAVYSLTGQVRYIEAAESVAREALDVLATGSGDYFSVPEGEDLLFKRPIEEFDGPSPAGQYALGIGFQRLYAITGEAVWKDLAVNLINARAGVAAAAPMAASTLVRLGSLTARPYTLVVAGPAGNPLTKELAAEARFRTGPDTMVVPAALAAGEVDWIELEGRTGLTQPQLLICREGSCMLPAFTVEEALERLQSAGLAGSGAGGS